LGTGPEAESEVCPFPYLMNKLNVEVSLKGSCI
jgi:hypothetical protein